jgi:hypothetical protein
MKKSQRTTRQVRVSKMTHMHLSPTTRYGSPWDFQPPFTRSLNVDMKGVRYLNGSAARPRAKYIELRWCHSVPTENGSLTHLQASRLSTLLLFPPKAPQLFAISSTLYVHQLIRFPIPGAPLAGATNRRQSESKCNVSPLDHYRIPLSHPA